MTDPQWINSLYYAYSTVAQSLASILGFTIAILVYRLTELNGSLRTQAQRLFEAKSDAMPGEIISNYLMGHFRYFVKVVGEHPEYVAASDPVKLDLALAQVFEGRISNLLVASVRPFLYSFFAIFFSVVSLVLAPWLAADSYRTAGALIGACLLIGIALFELGRLIRTLAN